MPREGVIVGLVGIVTSLAVLVAGRRLYKQRLSLKGWLGTLTLVLGIMGLVASVGWLILGAYIDAHVR